MQSESASLGRTPPCWSTSALGMLEADGFGASGRVECCHVDPAQSTGIVVNPGSDVLDLGRGHRLGVRRGFTSTCRPADEYLGLMSRLDRITSDPEICHGQPTIRGLRYPVEMLLELLASGMSTDEILNDYDDLERDDILAALEFGALTSGMRQVIPLGAA